MPDADQPALIYLEPDDEITSVVRRVRDAEGPRTVIVAPGRSKATSSAVALRLLQRVASEEGREVAIVGDALTRSLAAEAGLTTYASVADLTTESPADATQPRRAAIHVVRGDYEQTIAAPPSSSLGIPEPAASRPPPAPSAARAPGWAEDDTRVVPLERRPAPRPAHRARPEQRQRSAARPLPVALLFAVLALVVLAGAAVAAILPGAMIHIAPATAAVGPITNEVTFDEPQIVSGTVRATQEGTATGTYEEHPFASGIAVFLNWNSVSVEVPAGTGVAAGEVTFATAETVVVPPGQLTPEGRILAGEGPVPIGATAGGAAGNVAAHAINTVLDPEIDRQLRLFPNNPERTVDNAEPTTGGADLTGPVILQTDVDAAVAALTESLQAEVARTLEDGEGLVSADPPEPPQPTITGIEGLVDTRDQPTFELAGELAYDRAVVRLSEVEAAAASRLENDPSAVASGHELIGESIRVSVDSARRDGRALVAVVTVTAQSALAVDTSSLAERVAGLPVADAQAELANLGSVQIETWPDWVDSVPALTWRIEFRIEAPPAPSAQPSGSPAP